MKTKEIYKKYCNVEEKWCIFAIIDGYCKKYKIVLKDSEVGEKGEVVLVRCEECPAKCGKEDKNLADRRKND